MQTRKHYLGLLAAVAGIAGCAFLAFSRIPPPLVEAAHIVRPSNGMGSAHSYLWLNGHTLFLYEEQSSMIWPIPPSMPGSKYPVVRHIVIVDTQTGRKQTIACPPVPLQAPQQENPCDIYPTLQFSVSPDRKQLLAITDFKYSVIPTSSVNQSAFTLPWRQLPVNRSEESIDGCHMPFSQSYPGDHVADVDANHATWFSNGSWITMHYSKDKLVFRVTGKDSPETSSQAISLPWPLSQEVYTLRVAGASANGNMVLLDCPNTRNAADRRVYLLEFDPKAPAKVFDKAVLLPSLNGPPDVIDISLSPDGKRIAWLLPEYRQPPTGLQYWLFRYHLISHTSSPDTALWISDRHGQNMRLVKEWHNESSQLSSLQWCPDGSKVSFETMTESSNRTGTEFQIDTIAVGH
jgi:hypothetical protein